MSEKIEQEKPKKKEKGTWWQRYLRSMLKDWDTKVMVYVMLVVSAIALIAGTVAWFTYYPLLSAGKLGMTTADCDNLKVAINSEGADLQELQTVAEEKGYSKDSIVFSLQMPMYDNVEYYETTQYQVKESTDADTLEPTIDVEEKTGVNVNKLAPGVSGEITMYVTSLNKQINRFRITPDVLLTYADGEKDQLDSSLQRQLPSDTATISEADRVLLHQLVRGHILFFQKKESSTDSEGNVTYTYSQQIFPDSTGQYEAGPLEDDLVFDTITHKGEEKKITIYWVWPYEYEKIPEETKQYIEINSTLPDKKSFENSMFFCADTQDQMQQLAANTEEIKTQLYDYGDIEIGQLIKSVNFYFKIEGYHKEDPATHTVTESEPVVVSEEENQQ